MRPWGSVSSNHDVSVATVKLTLENFMSRYDNDRKECADRYRQEYDEKNAWRSSIDRRFEKIDSQLTEITTFLNQLRPKDKWLTSIVALTFLGAMGIIWKIIWDHVTGGGR